MKTPIYLDHHATTPVAPSVFSAMTPYFCEDFGNPSSSTHCFGWKAESAVTGARKQVAELLGAKRHEIYFTSGATESNNWALFGILDMHRKLHPGKSMHIVTSAVEHSSNLAAFKKTAGFSDVEVSVIDTGKFGEVDVKQVEQEIRPNTIYMSFIYGNNEIGTLNPISELGQLAKQRGVFFHSDAAQCCGNIPVDVEKLQVDLLSMASHKMYGPKGIGALYIRSHSPKVSIAPLLEGGGQEKGLRSGTLNVPGIVGLGAAAELAVSYLSEQPSPILSLSHYLLTRLKELYPNIRLNGHPTHRLPGNINVTIPELKIDRLLPRLSHIALSASSACGSADLNMSHVLKAIGLDADEAKHTLRFGLGRSTTIEQLDEVLKSFADAQKASEATL